MQRVFRTKTFSRWLCRAGLSDDALLIAAKEMAQGLIDADLGGDLYKKRIGLRCRGKRSGARTIVASRRADRWIFLFGFEKSERSNIDRDELESLQEFAKTLLNLDDHAFNASLLAGELTEIQHE